MNIPRLQMLHLQSNSETKTFYRSSHKLKFSIQCFILIWLCITLSYSTLNVLADEVAPPNGAHRVEDFDIYFEDRTCTVHGGECCSNKTSFECQGWFCIEGTCSALQCKHCFDDPNWFCGYVEGVTKYKGQACKYRATLGQPCDNVTMPCMSDLVCSGNNNTCQFTPERWEEYQEEVKSRRITMAGMVVVLLCMFLAMRRMVKNEEARRRQIWEPVDSSPEASILRRLAEDTQRRVAGGWGQISDSLVEGGNAASAAVGTAFTRIRNNVRNAAGRGARHDDCDDDTEMLPNGRRAQTRRELEDDMRNFLLEEEDEEDDEDDDNGHNQNWDRSRDEDGLLSSQRNNIGSGSSSRTNTPGRTNTPTNVALSQNNFPDEPPSYDEIREGQPSLIAGLDSRVNSSNNNSTV